ncbi:GNAT family N-acetyltransferase [Patescibacteria group bacterium]|nr:GNAT family N-acetyltransferase [Patescibacteria group bacterium]
MKLFCAELGQQYDTYTFGYANYCEKEGGDSLTSIYESGYLPYSGAPEAHNLFYMARSIRVLLRDFELSSENRRIAKKFDGRFTKERVPFAQFSYDDDFYSLFLTYFAQRHGDAMPRRRLDHILASGLVTNTLIYHSAGKPVAYVLEIAEGSMAHFWYSCYDLALAQQSLGLWLMLDALRDAKARGLEYYYLGTLYGKKALYKANFKPLQWWDGGEWNNNSTILKKRVKEDDVRTTILVDRLKETYRLF